MDILLFLLHILSVVGKVYLICFLQSPELGKLSAGSELLLHVSNPTFLNE